MDEGEADVVASTLFSKSHWRKLHSTNPVERSNEEVTRRADILGIFPDRVSITRQVGAILPKQDDGWQIQHNYGVFEIIVGRTDEQPATSVRVTPHDREGAMRNIQ